MTHEHPTNSLIFKEEDQLFTLIETSIVERYAGDLERQEDPRGKCADTYIPLDTDNIRELLTTLWGELVSAETIERAYTTLIEHGAEKWPLGWCEEDITREREERLSHLDYEIERGEQHLAELKAELNQLMKHHQFAD
jgi:hypothetical protein